MGRHLPPELADRRPTHGSLRVVHGGSDHAFEPSLGPVSLGGDSPGLQDHLYPFPEIAMRRLFRTVRRCTYVREVGLSARVEHERVQLLGSDPWLERGDRGGERAFEAVAEVLAGPE